MSPQVKAKPKEIAYQAVMYLQRADLCLIPLDHHHGSRDRKASPKAANIALKHQLAFQYPYA